MSGETKFIVLKRGLWFAVLGFVAALEDLGFYREGEEARNNVYSLRDFTARV
jgi:hypothetical protein